MSAPLDVVEAWAADRGAIADYLALTLGKRVEIWCVRWSRHWDSAFRPIRKGRLDFPGLRSHHRRGLIRMLRHPIIASRPCNERNWR